MRSSKNSTFLALTLVAGWACASSPALGSSAPLTSVLQVTSLSNAEAARQLPVDFEAIATFVRPEQRILFVTTDDAAVYVRFPQSMGLVQGDCIRVTGTTAASFRPMVVAQSVRFLRRCQLPKPIHAEFSDLIRARWDSRFVRVSGHVIAATLEDTLDHGGIRVDMKVPDGTIEGVILHRGDLTPEKLLESDIQIDGAAGGEYDSKMQLAGMWIDVDSDRNVKILRAPKSDPWSSPTTPLDEVVSSYRNSNASHRVRIEGALTYFEPMALAVIEKSGKSILVRTSSVVHLHPGMSVEATGFPNIVNTNVVIEDSDMRALPRSIPVEPAKISLANASSGQYSYRLVAIEGQVVEVMRDPSQELFIIRSDGQLFSATLRHSSSDGLVESATSQIPNVGSKVRVTGVCFVGEGNHWRDKLWFDLRMRRLSDVEVIQPASWWTVKRLAYISITLSLGILGAVLWVWLLGRRVREQSNALALQSMEEAKRQSAMARQEQQRSHVLELISSSEPLQSVLREITAMVSSRLNGVDCWFELRGQEPRVQELRVQQQGLQSVQFNEDTGHGKGRDRGDFVLSKPVLSPRGDVLGALMARPYFIDANSDEIAAALESGARLAALAIDTRRLYSDLRHRSEHDLLTDLPNRFSMEKHLDERLANASVDRSVFGLIYIDLDKFKQVNDGYGHHIGDLYLQEVARRMKAQLRQGDVLARIGGDEFMVMLGDLRAGSDAQEVALRLERSFGPEFDLDGHRLRGAASMGLAIYPEDGTTIEALQHSADAAMYAHKQTRRDREFARG